MTSSFSYTPGPNGLAPALWPQETSLPHHTGRATLVLFAHPRCPCSAASVEQLKAILIQARTPCDCCVVFLAPPLSVAGAWGGADWKTSNVVDAVKQIPAATVIWDTGLEARRFGAATSGSTLLYDAAGQLAFRGGITISRGHRGDNSGAWAVIQLLNCHPANVRQTPVFGCPLFQDNSTCGSSAACRN